MSTGRNVKRKDPIIDISPIRLLNQITLATAQIDSDLLTSKNMSKARKRKLIELKNNLQKKRKIYEETSEVQAYYDSIPLDKLGSKSLKRDGILSSYRLRNTEVDLMHQDDKEIKIRIILSKNIRYFLEFVSHENRISMSKTDIPYFILTAMHDVNESISDVNIYSRDVIFMLESYIVRKTSLNHLKQHHSALFVHEMKHSTACDKVEFSIHLHFEGRKKETYRFLLDFKMDCSFAETSTVEMIGGTDPDELAEVKEYGKEVQHVFHNNSIIEAFEMLFVHDSSPVSYSSQSKSE